MNFSFCHNVVKSRLLWMRDFKRKCLYVGKSKLYFNVAVFDPEVNILTVIASAIRTQTNVRLFEQSKFQKKICCQKLSAVNASF